MLSSASECCSFRSARECRTQHRRAVNLSECVNTPSYDCLCADVAADSAAQYRLVQEGSGRRGGSLRTAGVEFTHLTPPQNVQYLILALFWWTSKPVSREWLDPSGVVLIRMLIFPDACKSRSVTIHDILALPCPDVHSYDSDASVPCTRSIWLQRPAHRPPDGKETAALGKRCAAAFVRLGAFIYFLLYVTANYDGAMRAVAFIELLIMFRTLFGALLFRNSLLMPVFYAHFLRQRYYQSPFTRQAIEIVKRHTDAYVNKPGTHPVIVQIWSRFQMVVERWAGSALAPQQAQPAAAAGAARAQ